MLIQALEKWEAVTMSSGWRPDDHSIGYFGMLRNLIFLLKMPVVAENLENLHMEKTCPVCGRHKRKRVPVCFQLQILFRQFS